MEEMLCLQQKTEKGRVGWEKIAVIAVIARHRRNRKGKISPRRRGEKQKLTTDLH
jgi:hypothetical protein